MSLPTRISIPTLVRIKPGAIDRVGIYLQRFRFRRVVVVVSDGLPQGIIDRLERALKDSAIQTVQQLTIGDNEFARVIDCFRALPRSVDAIVSLGGGKATDSAKYLAFLAKTPLVAVPTSLSNDGFCSPQASLVIDGKRRSLGAALPFGVVVDSQVCCEAPRLLSLSGVGDLAAKFTAIYDWKLAFHTMGETVDDFAALLSDGSVRAFMANPNLELAGIQMLATSLMFNGIAMEVCGSSRPASGSEHMISHALDGLSARPRLHGVQVGVATYLISLLQQANSEAIDSMFETTGFWQAVYEDPFPIDEWIAAIKEAPLVKPDRFTILHQRDCLSEAVSLLGDHPRLGPCFVDN